MNNPPTPEPVTGCAKRFPMLDRHGHQIHVGDRLRYQHCTGRYGQTSISETVVTQPHYPYGSIDSAHFHLDFDHLVLRGFHHHDDFEHGHTTWVEILREQAPA